MTDNVFADALVPNVDDPQFADLIETFTVPARVPLAPEIEMYLATHIRHFGRRPRIFWASLISRPPIGPLPGPAGRQSRAIFWTIPNWCAASGCLILLVAAACRRSPV